MATKKKTIAEEQAERARILSGEVDQTSANMGGSLPKVAPPQLGFPTLTKEQAAEGLAAGREFLFKSNNNQPSPAPNITAEPNTEKPWWQTDIIPESADPAFHAYVNATPEPDIGPLDELSEDDREALSTALTKWNGITIDPVDPTTGNGGKDPEDKGGNGGDGGLGGVGIPDPVSYSSQYRAQMDAILRDLNLDKFKFDLNGEELYQQYKDQYLRNGRLAMMDTMGQATGLTGGYGSTYAQNAGQQAYQGYVNDLNNVVPDVYNAAYTRWRDSISDKLRQYELLANQDNTDYSRWYNDQQMDFKNRQLAADDATARYKAALSADTDKQKAQNDYLEIMGKYYGAGKVNEKGEPVVETPNVGADIHGISEKDLVDTIDKAMDNLYAQGGILGVYGGQMANMATKNPNSVARMLANKIGQDNGWDPTQISYATSYILALLKEED
jgi:hypothetical protein